MGHNDFSEKEGYSLLELMIALVIGSIMFFGIYTVSIQTMNFMQITRDESRAMQAAHYELEKIRSYSWSTVEGLAPTYEVGVDDNAVLGLLNSAKAIVKKNTHIVAGMNGPVVAISVTVEWKQFDGTRVDKTVTSLVTEKGLLE